MKKFKKITRVLLYKTQKSLVMDNGDNDASCYDWKPFEHQVAGHIYEDNHGMLISKHNTVLKPVQVPPKGQVEVDFYEKVFKKIKDPNEEIKTLKSFLPHYYGVLRLPKMKHPDIIESYLHLHDLTADFINPCVLDIKVGKRTWDHHASEAKMASEKRKCPFQGIIGFKIAGMKVYNVKTHSYDFYDRHFCRRINTIDELHTILLRFLDGLADQNNKESLLSNVLIKLREIQKWFSHQKTFSFTSSSVLIVYGAEQYDSGLNHINSGDSNHCEVKMIDFSHVYDAKDYDTNYLHGIESVIHHLERCLYAVKLQRDKQYNPLQNNVNQEAYSL